MNLFDNLFRKIPKPRTEDQLQDAIEKKRDEILEDQLKRSNAESKGVRKAT